MGGYLDSLPINATEDLSIGQYKAIDVDGTFAQANSFPIGIQQGKARSGEDATAGFNGRSRYVVGSGSLVAGARLTVVNSGYMVTATSGDVVYGRAIGAVTSGGVGEGIFDFANVPLLV